MRARVFAFFLFAFTRISLKFILDTCAHRKISRDVFIVYQYYIHPFFEIAKWKSAVLNLESFASWHRQFCSRTISIFRIIGASFPLRICMPCELYMLWQIAIPRMEILIALHPWIILNICDYDWSCYRTFFNISFIYVDIIYIYMYVSINVAQIWFYHIGL